MGISISLLLSKMYTKWPFSCRYGMFEYLVIPFGAYECPKYILEGNKSSSFFIYLIPCIVCLP